MIVVWRVLDDCNLSCPFCAFDKRLPFRRSRADVDEILRFAEVLAAFRKQTGEDVLVSWLGGEPFLWKPLGKLTRAVHAMGMRVSATTNGTTLGIPALRRHICEDYSELTISVDGFSALHDPMRGWHGGFEKLRAFISTLSADARQMGSPLKLRANVVLMRDNITDFPALCDELASWGISEITFNQLGGRDRPEFYPAHRLTPSDVERLAALLPIVRARLSLLGAALIGGERYLDRFRASARGEPNPIENCGPGESFLFIDERGRVSPCSFTSLDYGVDIRSLRRPDDVSALKRSFRQMQVGYRSRQCDDCLSTQVCEKFKPGVHACVV